MFMYRYLFQPLLSILLGICLLDHKVILCLNFLRKYHTVFHSDCTILHSQQLYTRVQFFYLLVNTCYFLLLLSLLVIAILTDRGWYRIVCSICISLIISDLEEKGHFQINCPKKIYSSFGKANDQLGLSPRSFMSEGIVEPI